MLRVWRGRRRMSQLDLALEADVSTKHVSFVETGRAQPSRDMVLHLADALEVPLRERNELLRAAGFAEAYAERALDDPELEPILRSIDQLLERMNPLPAILVDRHWNVRRQNRAALSVLGHFVDPTKIKPPLNAVRMVFEASGLRPWIANWREVGAVLIQRLHREALALPGDATAGELLEEALSLPDLPRDWRVPAPRPLDVVVPIHLRRDELELRLFSALTTLGTPQDVTLQELRLETFLPADAASEATLHQLVADA